MKKKTTIESSFARLGTTVSGRLYKLVRRVFPIGMHFSIEYDRNYGINSRKGWTVVIGYSVVCQLEKYFIWSLIKSLWKYQSWDLENKLKV